MDDKISNSALYWFNKDSSGMNASLALDLPFIPQITFYIAEMFLLKPSDIVLKKQKPTLSKYSTSSSSIFKNNIETASLSLYIGIGLISLIVIVGLVLYVFFIRATHEEREKKKIEKRRAKAIITKAKFKNSNAASDIDSSNNKRNKKKKKTGKKKKEGGRKSRFSFFNKKKRNKQHQKKDDVEITNLNILMNDTNGISANTSLQRLNKELEMVGIHDDTSSIDKKTFENPMFKK